MKQQRILSLLLASALTASLAAPAAAADSEATGDIVILHTNDTHCDIENDHGFAGVAGYKALMESEGNQVTLVDAGDFVQGGAIGALTDGEYIVNIMNEVGYDIVTLGNHEFDYQVPQMMKLMQDLTAEVTSSNFIDLATGESVYNSYVMETYGDVQVAFVGITTPESYTKTTPAYFMNEEGEYIYGFCEGNDGADLYANVQATVDAATEAGADYVIALAHLGVEETSAPWRSTDVVANTTGIDVIIDGHSHSTIAGVELTNKDGETVLHNQTGEKFNNIGKVTIAADGTITAGLVSTDDYAEKDADVQTFVDGINVEFDAILEEVVATTEVALTTTHPETGKRIVRSQECNMGDLVADAYRAALDADIAIINGGGIRANIEAGDITYGDIIAVNPWGNNATSIEATGQMIKDALENGCKNNPGESGGFLHVSGLTYTIDNNIPSSVVTNDKGAFESVAGEYRVSNIMVGDEELDLEATYVLASHDYMLLNGGDGMTMFAGAPVIKPMFMVDNETIIQYITEDLEGVVGEEYSNPFGAGRITVIAAPITTDYQVPADAWYFDAAEYVLENGYMGSTDEDALIFDGGVNSDRGTVFEALYNVAGAPEVAEAASFTDLEDSAYATSAAWAEDMGLTTGVGDGTYAGDREITRQEVATILARYADVSYIETAEGDLTTFTDADTVADWAVDGMTAAVGMGMIKGTDLGTLAPEADITRGEIAQILMNMKDLAPYCTETVVAIEVEATDDVPAHTIPATVTLPTAEGTFPAVVMLHGTGSNRAEAGNGYAIAAPEMAKQGVASIRIDFMGNGDSTASYTDYSYTSANIDAKAAADYMATLETVDADALAVMGWSQGGTNALVAAAEYPETFKAVITWSGSVHLDDAGLFPEEGGFDAAYEAAKSEEGYTMTFEWRDSLQVGAKWFEDVAGTDLTALMGTIEAPILAINGDLDTTVPMSDAEEIVAAAPNAKLYVAVGADHTYNVFSGDLSALMDTVQAGIDFLTAQFVTGYTVEAITVMNGEREVPAVVTMPVGVTDAPAVVMNHGHGGSKSENGGFDSIAEELAKAGIASIRMDFPGCGESTASFQDNYLSNMKADSAACLAVLIENYSVNPDAIGVMGYSMGGRIALETIAEADVNPYIAVALLSGSTDDGAIATPRIAAGTEGYDYYYAQAKEAGFATYPWYGRDLEISLNWFEQMLASQPLVAAADYTGPLMVVYGDADVTVSTETNEATVAAYAQAESVVIPGADHGYGFYSEQPEVTEAVETAMVTFFTENLCG